MKCIACGLRPVNADQLCWLCGMCECKEDADTFCDPHLIFADLQHKD